MRQRLPILALLAALLVPVGQAAAQHHEEDKEDDTWNYGLRVGAGYFSFRDSLFADRDPDPPGDLTDDWFEFYAKAWLAYQVEIGSGVLFARGSAVYAKTAEDAAEISGGAADSLDFDDLYLSYLVGSRESGEFEVSVGRIPYVLGRGLIIADGYADGGSRGAVWSNPRTAWANAGRARYAHDGHLLEYVHLERDDRPESVTDTKIDGVNYQWLSVDQKINVGATWMWIDSNDNAADLNGADVYNLRAYLNPFAAPLSLNMEWVREDNGDLLDASAWYVMMDYAFDEVAWRPVIEARYMHFEGDDPDTVANEDFNALFPGFYDWASWWQGEIAGEWFLSNSNLNTQMLRVHLSPTDSISTGLIYLNYQLDQPGSYQGGVASDDLASEYNWYLDWKINDSFSLSLVTARNQPGAAVEEAFDRSDAFLYGMIYVTFSIE